MIETHTTDIIFALTGLLIGLVIAEVFYKKAAKRTHHVMPATIVRNSHHVAWQKIFYYGVFCTFLAADHFLGIKVPEPMFWLDGFAMAGGDVQKLAVKFFRLK